MTQLLAAEHQRDLVRVAAEHPRRSPGWLPRRLARRVAPSPAARIPERPTGREAGVGLVAGRPGS